MLCTLTMLLFVHLMCCVVLLCFMKSKLILWYNFITWKKKVVCKHEEMYIAPEILSMVLTREQIC